MSDFYLALGTLSLFSVLTALVKVRHLYFFVPVYFFSAWLCGELSFIHLLWQLVLTLLFGLNGALDDPDGQLGLMLFILSWLGLLYLHAQSMDSASVLKQALDSGLGDNYQGDIPAHRQGVLRGDIESGDWLSPFRMRRSGCRYLATSPMPRVASATCWTFTRRRHLLSLR